MDSCSAADSRDCRLRIIVSQGGRAPSKKLLPSWSKRDRFQASIRRIGGDFNEASAFKQLYSRGQSSSIYRQERCDGRNIPKIASRHCGHKHQLSTRQVERAQTFIEFSSKHSRAALKVEAKIPAQKGSRM
jgi:hypothetical protein